MLNKRRNMRFPQYFSGKELFATNYIFENIENRLQFLASRIICLTNANAPTLDRTVDTSMICRFHVNYASQQITPLIKVQASTWMYSAKSLHDFQKQNNKCMIAIYFLQLATMYSSCNCKLWTDIESCCTWFKP